MLAYHLRLALKSLKQNPALTGLMVVAVALGVGATMTMLSLLHGVLQNPIGSRSAILYHVQIDARSEAEVSRTPAVPDGLTYQDALNIAHLDMRTKIAFTSANALPTRLSKPESTTGMDTVRAASKDFFSIFDVSFQYGAAWSARDDADRSHVAVISQELNNRLFGGTNSVGQTLVIATQQFRIVGVILKWNPQPHFYDVDSGAFGKAEDLYLPIWTWIDLPQDYGFNSMTCWGDNPQAGEHNAKAPNCGLVQMWALLPTAADKMALDGALLAYAKEQRDGGRFHVAPDVRLLNVTEWLDYKRLVPDIVRVQTWIACGVFSACILNTVGLLAVKFMSRSSEIGLRRALGAPRRTILFQYLTEAAMVGCAGGIAGIFLTWCGVKMVQSRSDALFHAANLDPTMLALTVLVSILATFSAGIWPAWRATLVPPGQQIKGL